MSIYSKTGDKGETSLCTGERISKTSCNIDSLGTIDELNSTIGVTINFADNEITGILKEIQKDLFNLGGELAGSNQKIDASYVEKIEKSIDNYESQLPEIKKFIIPGGSKAGSFLHLCRTTCRKAERRVVGIKNVNPQTISYLNRLSDLFFVLARFQLKQEGAEEQTI